MTSAPETSNAVVWRTEYERGGIPSSVREGPSGSVVIFLEFARAHGIDVGNAIDIGCGSGRNSIYLASLGYQVTAMDFVAPSIANLNRNAQAVGLPVIGVCHDVRQPWPIPDRSCTLGIDAFCFKHQIDRQDLAAYTRHAARTLAPGGLLMVSFAGRRDGYYAQFPTSYQDGLGQIILDPGNQILSRLYDPEEVIGQFELFEGVKQISKTSVNEMHGQSYERETHVVYLRRRE